MYSQECQDEVSSSVCDFQIPTTLADLLPQILIFLFTFEARSRFTHVFSTTNLSCCWSQGILPCVSRSFSCCFWYKSLSAIPPHCHSSGKPSLVFLLLCSLLTPSLGIYNSLSKMLQEEFLSFLKVLEWKHKSQTLDSGDSLVGKVFALKTWGSKFEPHKPTWKWPMWWWSFVIAGLERWRMSDAHSLLLSQCRLLGEFHAGGRTYFSR